VPRSITEGYLDDYNDILLDPEMKSVGIIRPEYTKSTLLIEFINIAQNELKLLERALDAVKTRKFGIEVTSDLVGCIATLHPLMHRKFALGYLPQMIEAVL
jgi:alanine dehydrogenase